MTFIESVSTCFRKYVVFHGIASRSEYWWFWLFQVTGYLVLGLLVSETLGAIFALATFLPGLAAAARRLHDTDRSGWWLLVAFVPLVGVIIVMVLLALESKPNRYNRTIIPA